MTGVRTRSLIVAGGMLGVLVVGVVIWDLASIAIFAVPSPVRTVLAFSELGGELTGAAEATFGSTAIAMTLAVAFGSIFGVVVGRSRYWYGVLAPIIVVGGATPKIVVYPVLLLLLGLGAPSVIAMGFIGGVFAILINVMVAARAMNPVYSKVVRAFGASRWDALMRVYLPAIRVSLMSGVRLCFGLTLVNVIFAELFAAKRGIGKEIMTDYGLGRYPEMMALMLILFAVALGVSMLLWAAERGVRARTM